MNHHDTRSQIADSQFQRHRVLCKFRGMLVIAEVAPCDDGKAGSCPECGSKEFHEHAGWTECDCGFAYLTADVNRLASEQQWRAEFEAWVVSQTAFTNVHIRRHPSGRYASAIMELTWQAFLEAKRG